MGELERLKAENPYVYRDAVWESELLLARRLAWREGIQAAWDAGWRPVPSYGEIQSELRQLDEVYEGEISVAMAIKLRQWLLERGNDDKD